MKQFVIDEEEVQRLIKDLGPSAPIDAYARVALLWQHYSKECSSLQQELRECREALSRYRGFVTTNWETEESYAWAQDFFKKYPEKNEGE